MTDRPGDDGSYEIAAAEVSRQFCLDAPVALEDFRGKGNIHNHTWLVRSMDPARPGEWLLQRINDRVFTRPRAVMASMVACLDAQRRYLDSHPLPQGDPWEPVTLVPTTGGSPYVDQGGRGVDVWRMMVKIPDCLTYKSFSEIPEHDRRLQIAAQAGRGLALYGDLTSGMQTDRLENPLPGYRDTRLYYNQLKSVLAGRRTLAQAAPLLPLDPVVRQSTDQHFLVHASMGEYMRRTTDPELSHFIELARSSEEFGLTLLHALEAGDIRRVAVHGDTKLENFLFDAATGQVKSLVDLDTIMPHTWLVDWGDMVRSFVNVAGEKERDLGRVQVDMAIYEATARGFLTTSREATPVEIALMADAVEIIALELGVRFLADYLRGDSYFLPGVSDPPDINRTRAMVQLRLFELLRARGDDTRGLIRALARETSGGRNADDHAAP